MSMNLGQEIPPNELQYFKEKVKHWLAIDKQVSDLEKQIKEIKKVKKELMPEITQFMVQYNITDLNTENGKLRCQERKTKKGLNKHNIRDNLSQFLAEQEKLDEAVNKIMNEREIVVKHVIKKVK